MSSLLKPEAGLPLANRRRRRAAAAVVAICIVCQSVELYLAIDNPVLGVALVGGTIGAQCALSMMAFTIYGLVTTTPARMWAVKAIRQAPLPLMVAGVAVALASSRTTGPTVWFTSAIAAIVAGAAAIAAGMER